MRGQILENHPRPTPSPTIATPKDLNHPVPCLHDRVTLVAALVVLRGCIQYLGRGLVTNTPIFQTRENSTSRSLHPCKFFHPQISP